MTYKMSIRGDKGEIRQVEWDWWGITEGITNGITVLKGLLRGLLTG